MARTAAPKIVEWGTPPDPEPVGWEAIAIELGKRPGRWANVGTYPRSGANRVEKEKLPASEGYEHRLVPVKDDPTRIVVWVRKVTGSDTVEERSAVDVAAPAEPKSRQVKRGGVV